MKSISMARITIVFIMCVVVILLVSFQMQLRGYTKLGRVEGFTLYVNTDIECDDITYGETTILCGNQYVLKGGMEIMFLDEALEEEKVSIIPLLDYVEIEN